jgi:hypothetical protein
MARLTGLEPATPGVTGRYSNQLSYNRALPFGYFLPHFEASQMRQGSVARLTGLEPATPGVTGRYSNQLSYNRSLPFRRYRLNVVAFYGSATGTSSAICTKCELLGKKNSRMQLARKRRP